MKNSLKQMTRQCICFLLIIFIYSFSLFLIIGGIFGILLQQQTVFSIISIIVGFLIISSIFFNLKSDLTVFEKIPKQRQKYKNYFSDKTYSDKYIQSYFED
jgi:hypothetical protein